MLTTDLSGISPKQHWPRDEGSWSVKTQTVCVFGLVPVILTVWLTVGNEVCRCAGRWSPGCWTKCEKVTACWRVVMKESLFSTCHRDVKNILSSHSETESHINTTQRGREPFVSSPGSSVICCPTCTLHAPHRLQLQPSAFLCVCVCVCVEEIHWAESNPADLCRVRNTRSQ